MDPRLLDVYETELRFLRELGSEFATEFPKVAARLGIEGFECSDPYVERLLEGVAFLTARVQLKLQDEHQTFTSQLLEVLYPHYNAPTPSMGVVQLTPNPKDASIVGGFAVPRGTQLQTPRGAAGATRIEYRTGHAATLWPLQLDHAGYLASVRDLAADGLQDRVAHAPGRRARAAVKVTISHRGKDSIRSLPLDELDLFLRGPSGLGVALYEQLLSDTIGVVVRPLPEKGRAPDPSLTLTLRPDVVRPLGMSDGDALLPSPATTFRGYRLLHEYFAFPDRYLFVRVAGLRAAISRFSGQSFELVFLLDRVDQDLERTLDEDHLALHCVPVVNLFPKHCDRVLVDRRRPEHQVIADRTRPLDFEVHTVLRMQGFSQESQPESVLPLYCTPSRTRGPESLNPNWYTIHRAQRLPSQKERRLGGRSSYAGTEVYASIVDGKAGQRFEQLGVEALCTNRDLPLIVSPGLGRTDLEHMGGEPIQSIRFLSGPSRPKEPYARDAQAWRLIGHLTLNHQTLLDSDDVQGAVALRELLSLYGDRNDAVIRKQVDSVRSVHGVPVIRRLPFPGPVVHGRGMQVTLTCDDQGFDGSRPFLMGAVLEQFFARYVSINSFTETVLRTSERGEVHRWPARTGVRELL